MCETFKPLTPEERREFRREWVAELRSGKHRQGHQQLENDEGERCCLGVACFIFVQRFPDLLATEMNGADELEYGGIADYLPEIVQESLGLETNSGDYTGSTLASENDAAATFSEIADIIESNPPGLLMDGELV